MAKQNYMALDDGSLEQMRIEFQKDLIVLQRNPPEPTAHPSTLQKYMNLKADSMHRLGEVQSEIKRRAGSVGGNERWLSRVLDIALNIILEMDKERHSAILEQFGRRIEGKREEFSEDGGAVVHSGIPGSSVEGGTRRDSNVPDGAAKKGAAKRKGLWP